MFTTFFSLSLLLVLIRSVLAQSEFTIDTPSFVQCQLAQITWTDSGNPPYDLLIAPADDPCGEALVDLGNQTTLYVNWTVTLPAGTQVVLSLEDAAGNEAWSGNIVVGPSGDTSCLPSNSTSPAPTTSALGTSSVPPRRTSTTSSPSPSSSAFSPAAAAGNGIVPASGALSTHSLSAVTLLGSAALAVAAFIV